MKKNKNFYEPVFENLGEVKINPELLQDGPDEIAYCERYIEKNKNKKINAYNIKAKTKKFPKGVEAVIYDFLMTRYMDWLLKQNPIEIKITPIKGE